MLAVISGGWRRSATRRSSARQLEQAVDAVLRLVGIEGEAEADRGKADRRGPIDPERPPEIEVALGLDAAALQAEFESRRDRPQRHPAQAARASSSMSPEQ